MVNACSACFVRREALLIRVEVKGHPPPGRRSGWVGAEDSPSREAPGGVGAVLTKPGRASGKEAAIVALAVCLVTGLPGDWARRRASGATAGLMQVVTVAGIVGAVAIDAAAGWPHGFWPVAVMVIAIVLGEVLADQLATRFWDQPRRPGRLRRARRDGRRASMAGARAATASAVANVCPDNGASEGLIIVDAGDTADAAALVYFSCWPPRRPRGGAVGRVVAADGRCER
jgi:hypothetical protein